MNTPNDSTVPNLIAMMRFGPRAFVYQLPYCADGAWVEGGDFIVADPDAALPDGRDLLLDVLVESEPGVWRLMRLHRSAGTGSIFLSDFARETDHSHRYAPGEAPQFVPVVAVVRLENPATWAREVETLSAGAA